MLVISFLVAVSVKPSPMLNVKGTFIAVSSDGSTLAASDGRSVYLHNANTGKKLGETSKAGAKPGPLLAAGPGFVVQVLGEKKKRFAMVVGNKVEPVPFRLPKDSEVPALLVAFAPQASTMVGLLTPTASLTDVLAWDFSQKPPLESPRTGLAAHCWLVWTTQKKARVLCEDGLHLFELDPPGNNNQVGAADEAIVAPRDALSAGHGDRIAWIAAGEMSVDDFSAEPRVRKSAKLPPGSIVQSVAIVPGKNVVVATLPHDGVVWVWDYGVDAFSKVKVANPTHLAVSEVTGKVWARTAGGVLRLDIGD